MIMTSNKNFSSEVPAGLQDVKYVTTGPVRAFMEEGEPWFVANDVCQLLGFKNPRDAVSRLDDFEVRSINVNVCDLGNAEVTSDVGNADTTSSRARKTQQMNFVNESGLYHLCFISRNPEAVGFRRWVTGTLLPTLRKTGRYEIGTPKRRRLLPRDRKEIDPNFWTEIRKYVLPKDIRDVAARMNVTLRHAQKVLAGTVTSYPVMEQFVVIGASNRANGIMRPEARHYEQLVFQFAEPNGKEG